MVTEPYENKSPQMKEFLKKIFPQQAKRIEEHKCATCGKQMSDNVQVDFRNALSLREYGISGMYQDCQDSVSGI